MLTGPPAVVVAVVTILAHPFPTLPNQCLGLFLYLSMPTYPTGNMVKKTMQWLCPSKKKNTLEKEKEKSNDCTSFLLTALGELNMSVWNNVLIVVCIQLWITCLYRNVCRMQDFCLAHWKVTKYVLCSPKKQLFALLSPLSFISSSSH